MNSINNFIRNKSVSARMKHPIENSKLELKTGDKKKFLHIIKNCVLTAQHYATQPKEIELCTDLLQIIDSNSDANNVFSIIKKSLFTNNGKLKEKIKSSSSSVLSSLKSVLGEYFKEYGEARNRTHDQNKTSSAESSTSAAIFPNNNNLIFDNPTKCTKESEKENISEKKLGV